MTGRPRAGRPSFSPSHMSLLLAGGCFLALTGVTLLGGVLSPDVVVRDALLAWATPSVLRVMRVANSVGDWRVILPGTLVLLLVSARARARWWIWLGLMVMAPIAEGALKHLIGRARPEDPSLGFPSGHATAAAAFLGAVVYLAGGLPSRAACLALRILAVIVLVLVAAARVMLRAHWPSDALAGIALGLALASATALVASGLPPVRNEG